MVVKKNRWFFFGLFLVALGQNTLAEHNETVPQLPYSAAENNIKPDPVFEEITEQKNMPIFENGSDFTKTAYNTGFSKYLNALEFSGYFRSRLDYFRNPHLMTHIPKSGVGTSNMLPNLNIYNEYKKNSNAKYANPDQNMFSGNMRLRLEPTLNVSQTARIKSTFDIFDNLVMGSTPNYIMGSTFNPYAPVSVLSMSQNAPVNGVNSGISPIMIKRLWAEIESPIGDFRFGRMPIHWGLGIIYNSGADITSDYGDQIDGFSFTTSIFEHHFNLGYSFAYVGPVGRNLGNWKSNNKPNGLDLVAGQYYPLESKSTTHVLMMSILKRESSFINNNLLAENNAVFNYGFFGSYRKQNLDNQFVNLTDNSYKNIAKKIVKRDANIGLGSIWSEFNYQTFHIEAEAAGMWGQLTIGENDQDELSKKADGTFAAKRELNLLQGGLAIESRYGFLQNSLQVGLNGGIASWQSNLPFIHDDQSAMPITANQNNYVTNFKFNPAYTIDLLMYREVMGQVSGTFYVKPHLSYFFSRHFGIRTDVISSFAGAKETTAGKSNWLGVELDGSAFFKSDNGFYFSLAYGILFPLKGMSHEKTEKLDSQTYGAFGQAKMAQTLQSYFGLIF